MLCNMKILMKILRRVTLIAKMNGLYTREINSFNPDIVDLVVYDKVAR